MIAIKATVRNGRIVLDEPLSLPDGTELWIPIPDREDAMTPEEIASVLAAIDEMQPLEMTDEELAGLEADRRTRKECEKANFNEHAEKLRRMWE